jgi:UDP-4-amino-4-deoxy-L-arabinose-oxoglutarate aminotransferase
MQRIPFFRHDLGQPELDAVAEVLRGPILTTGETVDRFEQQFAGYLGCRNVVTVSSCTAGLQLALTALGVGQGDEVVTTPMSFIATATAILQAGATPVFVDVEPDTGNLDADRVEAALTPRTRAILPVHLYGQMCDMRRLRALADRHGLAVVEDAAHCVEGSRDGVRVGQLGDAACFSFYATKNLTCGEGGAVATNDDALARKLKLLRLHGMTRTAADRQREGYQHWDMVVFGWKYNLDNIQAALLLPQLARLEETWQKREALAQRYLAFVSGLHGVTTPNLRPNTRHARHLFPVWVGDRRDEVVASLQGQGVGVVVNYRAMHLLSFFRQTFGFQPGVFPEAERIGDATLSLPFYPAMPAWEVEAVCDLLAAALRAKPLSRAA